MTLSWVFRPSILSLPSYKDASLPRETFLEYYRRDNSTAQESGVTIRSPAASSRFRTLQWNLNGWAGDAGTSNPLTHSKQIISTILQADADCIILNEYHCYDKGHAHVELEHTLRQKGYTTQQCGTVFCPTFMATRCQCTGQREIALSSDRSALILTLQVDDSRDSSITVIGTHLDYMDGRKRGMEMQTLVQELFRRHPQEDSDSQASISPTSRMILAGDLNQQRRSDYSLEEWKGAILPNMRSRKSVADDGVEALLRGEGFICAWEPRTHSKVTTNWTTAYPPSTHWSGTIVDYSYGRNVQADSISICPAAWSDHRMTVVDWTWGQYK